MAIIHRRDNITDADRWNRFFSDPWYRGAEEEMSGCWCPSVDIYEDGSNVVLTVELPGMEKKDVSIQVENNVLTISGERKFIEEEKRANYNRIERCYGDFTRSFTLGQTVDQGGIGAAMDKGILTITLPKKEESKPKQIEVKVQ
ncbi:MAG: Hsp20/alpha crystallin family protein [Alphaproteobacteria bacterium]